MTLYPLVVRSTDFGPGPGRLFGGTGSWIVLAGTKPEHLNGVPIGVPCRLVHDMDSPLRVEGFFRLPVSCTYQAPAWALVEIVHASSPAAPMTDLLGKHVRIEVETPLFSEPETVEQIAVTCPRWRWMEGMLAKMDAGPHRLAHPADIQWVQHRSVPDLTDPATKGALLHLVREAWGDPGLYAMGRGGWRVCGGCTDGHQTGLTKSGVRATEAEALVAALKAAP